MSKPMHHSTFYIQTISKLELRKVGQCSWSAGHACMVGEFKASFLLVSQTPDGVQVIIKGFDGSKDEEVQVLSGEKPQ